MNIASMVVLIVSTCGALLVAPDIRLSDLGEPVILATLGMPPMLATLVVLRMVGAPAVVERRLLAMFLILMPIVYVSSLARHGGGAPWPVLEIVGVVIFVALTVAGLLNSGWYLALGIAAHGLCWDAWHHGRAPFIPDWYTVGCLIVDVGFGLYAMSRVAVWHAEAEAMSAPARSPFLQTRPQDAGR